MRESDKVENFIEAFHSHGGGCRRECDCGKEFYNPEGGWDWEDGELERLRASKATALEWTVSTIFLEGKEYVIDCKCWRKRAEQIMSWMDSNADSIAQYLTLEKKRKQRIADQSPVVKEL